jgi:galactokinase
MSESAAVKLATRFMERFNCKPRVFSAPGRVNLIGEHTDYNDGFVMPAAIGFSTFVAAAPRLDRRLVVRSENYHEERVFDLDEVDPKPLGHWSDYVRGVSVILERRADHRLRGANLLVKGEVPLGAGLSSSAAIEVATALALLGVAEEQLPPVDVALLCQRAENDFVGMRCGAMDQFIACHAQPGQALMLDCRSLEFCAVPLPASVRLVICNTMVKHELASSEYNQRRAECETGVELLRRSMPTVRALRDVSMNQLSITNSLPPVIASRCRHVVSENARVREAAAALESGDLGRFGRLLAASHASLRDDYKVSCAELDFLVELASSQKGVFGARMTGGGFGGCTINIVAEEHVDGFVSAVGQEYEAQYFMKPDIYVCTAKGAADEVTPT